MDEAWRDIRRYLDWICGLAEIAERRAEWIVILPGPSARMPNGSMEATMGEMDHRRALLRDELGR